MPRILLGVLLVQMHAFISLARTMCRQKTFPHLGERAMQTCIAQCLELNSELRSCTFNSKTGRAEGDACTENFDPIERDKIFSCRYHHESFIFHSKLLEKVCDQVTMDGLLKWDRAKKELVEAERYMRITKPFRDRAMASKIKTWLHLGADIDSDLKALDWSELTSDPDQRKRLITRISGFLTQYRMQGVYIEWKYPGCPDRKMGNAHQKDKGSSIAFFKELALELQAEEKVVAIYARLISIEYLRCLGPDHYQNLIKYVNYTVLDAAGLVGLWKPTLDLPRSIQNMDALIKSAFTIYGPGLRKKAILVRDLMFHEFVLLNPAKNTIGSQYNQSASEHYLPMNRICATVKNKTMTRVIDLKTQRFAFSAKRFVPYEDMEHAQTEVEKIIKKFDMAGFHMDMIQFDDVLGECGSGKFPYIRMYAEALKGGACIFKDFV